MKARPLRFLGGLNGLARCIPPLCGPVRSRRNACSAETWAERANRLGIYPQFCPFPDLKSPNPLGDGCLSAPVVSAPLRRRPQFRGGSEIAPPRRPAFQTRLSRLKFEPSAPASAQGLWAHHIRGGGFALAAWAARLPSPLDRSSPRYPPGVCGDRLARKSAASRSTAAG